jgi:hypothetical protein
MDVMILHEGLTVMQRLTIESLTARKIIFVDVTSYFTPRREWEDIRKKTGCAQNFGMGYKLMCRFWSGPVYWLKELEPYRYLIRLDDDSRLTKIVPTDFIDVMHLHNATYGYILEELDSPDCMVGATAFMTDFTQNHPLPQMRHSALKYDADGEVTRMVYNCNFEVVDLEMVRSAHYRTYFDALERSGLFFTTRLGDHQAKTMYVETYQVSSQLICFRDVAYHHPGMVATCKENVVHTSYQHLRQK